MKLSYRDNDLRYKISFNIVRRVRGRYRYNRLLNINLRYRLLIYYFLII